MNKIKKLITSLEKNYDIKVQGIIDDYANLESVRVMASNAGVNPYVIRSILLQLQLKRPKSKRKVCVDEYYAMLNGENITEFTNELEADNDLLSKKVNTLERALVRARVDLNTYRKTVRYEAKGSLIEDRVMNLFSEVLKESVVAPVKYITGPKSTTSRAEYVPCLVISDVHAEESVEASQVGSLNTYNWEIMTNRLESVFCELVNSYKGEERVVVLIAGDMFSGVIHDQTENSTKPLAKAIVDLANQISDQINGLACIYDIVDVYCVNGNHSRLGEKIKTEAKGFDFEYIFGNMLKALCTDTNITIDISSTGFNHFKIKDTVVAVHHGDFFRQPVGSEPRDFRIYEAFKASTGEDARHIIQGHTHQFQVHNTSRGTSICNGSLIGSNNYGHTNGFVKIPASQTLVMFEPTGNIEYVKQIVC